MSQNSWHAWTTGPLDQAKMSMKPSFGFQLHEGHKMTKVHPRTGKKKCGNYSHLVLGVDVNQLFVAYFFERRIIKKKLAFMHHVQVAVSQSMELPANTEGPWIKLPSFFHPPWQNWSDELCAAPKNFLACHHMKNDYSHSKPGSILQFGQNMLFVPKMMIQNVPALLHINTINTNQLPSALREVQRGKGVFIGTATSNTAESSTCFYCNVECAFFVKKHNSVAYLHPASTLKFNSIHLSYEPLV